MSKKNHHESMLSTFVLPISLVCLFAFSALVLTFLGSQSYKNIKKNYDATNKETVAVSYLTTKLRQNNTKGAIRMIKKEDGDQLVLTEVRGEKIYNTIIFCKDKNLYETYIEQGRSVQDGGAMRITDMERMELTPLSDHLLEIKTYEDGEEHRFTVALTDIQEQVEEGVIH